MRWIGVPDVWDARKADPGFMASLATFAVLGLGLDLVVDGTVLTLTGTVPTLYPLGWQAVVWAGLGILWWFTARALVLWSRRRGVDPLPSGTPDGRDDAALGHRAWRTVLGCAVGAVVVAIVLPALLGVPGLAPVERFATLYEAYGAASWVAVLAWLVRLVGRCAVLASILAYAHRAVLSVVTLRGARWVPWGGLALGAVTGAVALLSRGPAVALSTLVVCTLLGVVHVRGGESLRITAPFTLLAFAVL